jgi:uncharacterized Ntn-hydrolase superfamily protein
VAPGAPAHDDIVKATFSIVAADPASGEVGCAVQSKYFAVGAVVPWVKAGVGAVATQAAGVAALGPSVLSLLELGVSTDLVLGRALSGDARRETRQLGVVAAAGGAATFTGADCLAWAGGCTGEGYAVQGNILTGPDVVQEMERAFLGTAGSLAGRLTASLEAGQAAGGDSRGQQSAALVVEQLGAGMVTREGIDRTCDLRVDDHPEPIAELRRLVEIHGRWDALRRASGHYEAERWEEGVATLRAALETYPGDATLLYDLACFQARGENVDDALESLRRSLVGDPEYRSAARVDTDFASLVDDPRFRELVGL